MSYGFNKGQQKDLINKKETTKAINMNILPDWQTYGTSMIYARCTMVLETTEEIMGRISLFSYIQMLGYFSLG